MKPILEVALQEWAVTRDKLLDTFVEKTAEVDYPMWFIAKVQNDLNLDLSRLTPRHPDSLDAVIREINAIRSVIDDIDDFFYEEVDGKRVSCKDLYEDDEYDPYCEDVYHEDDPRLFEGATQKEPNV